MSLRTRQRADCFHSRSRAPALERIARRLPPPESAVEAGASETVCSEAGASEQGQLPEPLPTAARSSHK